MALYGCREIVKPRPQVRKETDHEYHAQQGATRIHNRTAQSVDCEPRWPGWRPVGRRVQAVSPQGALLDQRPSHASGGTETHTLDSLARLDDRGQRDHRQARRQREILS